ncbi:hypothetical protein [Cohnella luojiensis]|uniref:Uncharacterized protein n=1 Tax=Cohnella luojiensis TaxID=652876 RepID=A0A4Y8LTR7_9BACL|nr:hypothetical protein [Cohnella luojiensis]TFE19453.1 hypothetical protein E2980_23245 [Cohnella luojiensis]
MSLALHSASLYIQNKLHALAHSHLSVRIHDRNLVIYSLEREDETYRAVLTCFPGNEYMLCIANHRGGWQLIPQFGSIPELMSILTGKLAFTLTRWH